jgi:hypothetical protein
MPRQTAAEREETRASAAAERAETKARKKEEKEKPKPPTGAAAANAGAAGTTTTGEVGHKAIEEAGGEVKDPEGFEGHAGSATIANLPEPETTATQPGPYIPPPTEPVA